MQNKLFRRRLLTGITLILLGLYDIVDAQEIQSPDTSKSDQLIFDPASFDPKNSENSLFKPQPLGDIKPTTYTRHEREDGSIVIKAESVESASGLVVPVDADPSEFRYIQWEWKIESVLEDGDLTKKDGDDYAARVYITFDYDKSNLGLRDRTRYFFIRTFTSFEVPLRSLNYIWANRAEKGTIAESPYTDWVQLIAVQSGNENSGKWMVDTRDILEDYREAFGEEPPNINGISIMTDSDNTSGSAVAFYGKIKLSKKPFSADPS